MDERRYFILIRKLERWMDHVIVALVVANGTLLLTHALLAIAQ